MLGTMSVAEHQILACDIGLKRIGCAHRLQGIILPLSPIIRHNRNQAASALTNLLNTRDIRILVVGIPRDNATTTERIKHFVGLLDFCGEVVYIDEDFTSINALESLQHVRKKVAPLIVLKLIRYCKKYQKIKLEIQNQERV